MRFFNTAGPVRPDKHYAIEPLERLDVDELLSLIQTERYFVLQAPRQSGKTSTLIALRDLLNSGKAGNFRSCCWWTKSIRWSVTRCFRCCVSFAPVTNTVQKASRKASCSAA